MTICPKCKNGDHIRRVSEIYTDYQHKAAVKNFFGDEVCAEPDHLRDRNFESWKNKKERDLFPPPEPRLIKFPAAIMALIFIGSVLVATFIGMHLIGLVYVIDKPGSFILILGLLLVSVSLGIFITTTILNRNALRKYDVDLENWKKLLICTQCRSIFFT